MIADVKKLSPLEIRSFLRTHNTGGNIVAR